MPTSEKRTRIIDTAAKLFAKKGFENTTTRDICKATGMSHAMIYYYFDDKESLLYEILDEILSEGLRAIKKIDRSSKSLKEKLAAITDVYARYHVVKIDKMKVFVHEQKSLKPEHKKKVVEYQREYLDILVNILKGLKQENQIVNLDTKAAAFTFFGMVHWAYRWYDPKGKIKPKQLSQIINRIFTEGIYSD
jgi:AcrR family transcriptional regulator